jgi:hypothetical protein
MAQDNMTDEPNISQEEAQKISAQIKTVIDPIFEDLCKISAKLDKIMIGGVEIQTPTGKFMWQPNFGANSKGERLPN